MGLVIFRHFINPSTSLIEMGNKSGSYDLGEEKTTLKDVAKVDHSQRLVTSSTIRRKTNFQTGAGEMQWEGEVAAKGDLIRASSCKPITATPVMQSPQAVEASSS